MSSLRRFAFGPRRITQDLLSERGILIALVLSALSLWAFAALADAVAEGSVLAVDELVFRLVHGDPGRGLLASPHAVEAMRDITALGSYSVLGLATFGVCGYLAIIGDRRAALFVLLAVFTGIAVSQGLKLAFARPRPELVSPHVRVFTMSFPSGHSLLSAVVYLTLGSLLARLHSAWRAKLYVLGMAVLITALVGLSRLLLGVHWPTDILAGWAVGASWSLLCWAIFLFLQERRTVERPAPRGWGG